MGLQSLGASMCQNTAFDAGWYCRSPVNNVRRQLHACTRRAISLLQNKGILRDDNCSPSLPSYPYSRNTNARLRTTLQKFALHRFFIYFLRSEKQFLYVARDTKRGKLHSSYGERREQCDWSPRGVLSWVRASDCLALYCHFFLPLWTFALLNMFRFALHMLVLYLLYC